MNRKIIKTAFIFSAACICLMIVVQKTLDAVYNKRSTGKFTQLVQHKIDPQIIIFGSSVAYQQIDPNILTNITGHTAYNMGWDGTFFAQYEGLIYEFLSYTKNCRQLIIACDVDNLGRNKLITRPDLYYSILNNNNIYSSLKTIQPKEMFLAKYIPGYKLTLYNSNFYKLIFIDYYLNKVPDMSLGYEPTMAPFDTLTTPPFNARYEEQVYERIRKSLKRITDKNIEVFIVMTPLSTIGQAKVKNLDYIRRKYNDLSGNNIHVIDYTATRFPNNELKYFTNLSHLNKEGAEVFSKILAEDIKNHNIN